MIKALNQFDQFEQLVQECRDLVKRVPFKDHVNQLSLQVEDPNVVDWYGSCGGIFAKSKVIVEKRFKHINPELKGTAIESWLDSLGVPVFRARLMYMNPMRTYSVHKDPFPRIHIPIVTNPDCFMCFPDLQIMKHMPATGESYWVDTTVRHTFVNCSNEDRIHLVVATELRLDSV